MNVRTFTTITAGITLVVTLSACGSSATHPATSKTHRPDAPVTTTPSARSRSLLPAPSGSFPVGVRTVPNVSPDATTTLWYPAQRGTRSGTIRYVDSATASAMGLSPGQLDVVRVHATTNTAPAPAATARPVVVLMPGWGNPMALSTTLAQDLASHGYVVVAIDPNPGSEDRNTLPADTARPGRRLEQVAAGIDFAAGREIDKLVGPVDRDRIAIGGHSIAGAVAFQVAITDRRIHAIFNLDGWLHGPALTTPVEVPALALDASGLDAESQAVIARTGTAVTVKLDGATHLDVTDLPCLIPALGALAPVLRLGSIGCTGPRTSSAIVVRFLDAVLKDGVSTPSATALSTGLQGAA